MKIINIPRFDELSISNIFKPLLKEYPHVEKYFPTYKEKYLPSRDFFWKVFTTLKYDVTNDYINKLRSLKHKEKEKESERTIEINEEILDELYNAQYFSKKKGRALFTMDMSKPRVIKKKRHILDLFRQDAEEDIERRSINESAYNDEEEKERLIEQQIQEKMSETLGGSGGSKRMMPIKRKLDSDSKRSDKISRFSANSPTGTHMSQDETNKGSGFRNTKNPFGGNK